MVSFPSWFTYIIICTLLLHTPQCTQDFRQRFLILIVIVCNTAPGMPPTADHGSGRAAAAAAAAKSEIAYMLDVYHLDFAVTKANCNCKLFF